MQFVVYHFVVTLEVFVCVNEILTDVFDPLIVLLFFDLVSINEQQKLAQNNLEEKKERALFVLLR